MVINRLRGMAMRGCGRTWNLFATDCLAPWLRNCDNARTGLPLHRRMLRGHDGQFRHAARCMPKATFGQLGWLVVRRLMFRLVRDRSWVILGGVLRENGASKRPFLGGPSMRGDKGSSLRAPSRYSPLVLRLRGSAAFGSFAAGPVVSTLL